MAVDTREQLPLPITRLKTVVSGMRAYSFRRLLIVGNREDIENGKYRSNVSVAAVLASLSSWEVRFGVPVVYSPTPETAARQVESWLFWCAREIVMGANNLFRGCVDSAVPT